MNYGDRKLVYIEVLLTITDLLIKVKLELLTDIDMLIMVEKEIRGEICHAFLQYVKVDNKYIRLWWE